MSSKRPFGNHYATYTNENIFTLYVASQGMTPQVHQLIGEMQSIGIDNPLTDRERIRLSLKYNFVDEELIRRYPDAFTSVDDVIDVTVIDDCG